MQQEDEEPVLRPGELKKVMDEEEWAGRRDGEERSVRAEHEEPRMSWKAAWDLLPLPASALHIQVQGEWSAREARHWTLPGGGKLHCS